MEVRPFSLCSAKSTLAMVGCSSSFCRRSSVSMRVRYKSTVCSYSRRDGGRHSFYSVLGVSPDGTLQEIKVAYRKLARQYHPDVCPGENLEEYTSKFLQIHDAYDYQLVLADCRLYEAGRGVCGGDRYGWRSIWERQLEVLARKGMRRDLESQSWGARMRKARGVTVSTLF